MRTLPHEYKFIFAILRKNISSVIGMLVFDILLGIIGIIIPYFTKLQIDQLERQHTEIFGIITGSPVYIFIVILLLLFLVELTSQLMQFAASYFRGKVAYRLSSNTEDLIYEKLKTFDASFLSNKRNSRLLNMIFDITHLAQDVVDFITTHMKVIITILGIIPILTFIDWKIFIIAIIASGINALFIRQRTKDENVFQLIDDQQSGKYYEFRYLLNKHFHDILSIGGESYIMKQYEQLRERRFQLSQKRMSISQRFHFFTWLTNHLAELCMIIIIGYQVFRGDISLGTYTMVTIYANTLHSAFKDMFSINEEIMKLQLVFYRLGFFLSLKPRYNRASITPLHDKLTGNVKLDKVSFRYPNFDEDEKTYVRHVLDKTGDALKKVRYMGWRSKEVEDWKKLLEDTSASMPLVLEDISFECKKGEITALVGKNGSGKTTLVNLLLRNMDTEKGSISFGNRTAATLDPKDIRKYVSIIHQEPFVLDEFSIRENLTIGSENHESISDETLWTMLEKVGLKSAVDALPKKLESILGDDVHLSGGQNQLLVIARVLLQKRPFIIFDEGTNQLDAEHELAIMKLLEEYKKESTVIMITHRMTSARKADYIYVLNQGKMAQKGTHAALLQDEGLYKNFWNIQVID